ncbi:peptidylprolyl isomerase [Ekhidna sp. To15]|uniref:peptidylprolyl isomerase n=1 Tax=Ekhidna sp. To15 TaxID=3395267 RepID=UPI003F522068
MKNIIFSLFIIGMIAACGDKNKDYLVKIKTIHGDMTVVLYDETPLHKKNFLELAQSGAYDSTNFHRIMEDFMIQGGNVVQKSGDTEGADDRIPAEFVDGYYHTKGSLAAARQPDNVNPEKGSSATQYYIVDGMSWEMMSTDVRQLNQRLSEILQDTAYSDLLKQFQDLARNRDSKGMNDLAIANRELVEEKYGIDLTVDVSEYPEAYQGVGGSPFLDGEYTVFGKVIDGMDVIDKIAGVAVQRNPVTGENSTPVEPVYVTMEVMEMSKKKITETYGYTYPESE